MTDSANRKHINIKMSRKVGFINYLQNNCSIVTKVPWCIVLMPIGTPFKASLLREDLKASSQTRPRLGRPRPRGI